MDRPTEPRASPGKVQASATATGLTFHPARDDPKRLRAFLRNICEEYAKNSIHARAWQRCIPAASSAPRVSSSFSSGLSSGVPLFAPGAITNALHRSSAKVASKADPENSVAATMRRKTVRQSLLRVRELDMHAPDPEEESPSSETEEDRRRRRERINGRRKRVKKMIEIDALTEQYHKLKGENQELRSENDSLRDRISVLRELLRSVTHSAVRQHASVHFGRG